jgi:hypothetical protein
MQIPHPAQLLRIWEDGLYQSTLEKTVRLLAAACQTPDLSLVSQISIGERDARLLQLREWMFGRQLKNMSTCPICGQMAEWENRTDDLRLQAWPTEPVMRTFNLTEEGFDIKFRLPHTADMAKAIADARYREQQTIFNSCILEVKQQERETSAGDIPAHIREVIEKRMSEEDPQADIRMQISCPSCEHQWETRFDIVNYLWTEINNWAKRMLRDIYLLARTFSWSEKEILSMTAQRRQHYLQMIGS